MSFAVVDNVINTAVQTFDTEDDAKQHCRSMNVESGLGRDRYGVRPADPLEVLILAASPPCAEHRLAVRRPVNPPIMSIDLEGHGHYALRTWQFDVLISRYLPASPAILRADLNERGAEAGINYDDVTDVTSLLFILGEYDGMVS